MTLDDVTRSAHPWVRADGRAGLRVRAQQARDTATDLCAVGVRFARQRATMAMLARDGAPAESRRVVGDLARAAGATEAEYESIRLVVSELVSNVARHAYDDEVGMVYLDAAVVGHGLTIIVSDDGRGPRVASPRPGPGLGWKIVAQLAPHFTVAQRGAGGTQVYVRMPLAVVVP